MRTTGHRVHRTFIIAARYVVLILTILGCLGLAWSAYAATAPEISGDAGVQLVTSVTPTDTLVPPTATNTPVTPTATATTQATATPTGTAQPTPTGTAQPTATRAPRSGAATGGHVTLSINASTVISGDGGSSQTLAGAWGVIQWQDGEGAWHNVDGWSGTIGTDGPGWWVAPKDFGTGPFRWCVYSGPNDVLLGLSEPFYLPTRAGEMIEIMVSPMPSATPAAQ